MLSKKLFPLKNWIPLTQSNLLCHSVFLHCHLVIGCARKDAPMCFIDRKVSIFGALRYVKGWGGNGSVLGMYFYKTDRH